MGLYHWKKHLSSNSFTSKMQKITKMLVNHRVDGIVTCLITALL